MTINQLKTLFKYIGDSHYFIKTTEFGEVPSKAEANTESTVYPAFYQVLDTSTQLSNTIQRTFTLIVCDLVFPGHENLDEVHSDTEQTLSDIIKILRQESEYYDVIGDPVIVPFKDRYGDAVAGHEATVVIETTYNDAFCDIPSDAFGYPGQTGTNGIPFPPQFDCDSLASCSVIQGIQTDISTLFIDSIFTATNGLTKTLNNVDWGGPLNQSTTINGQSLYDLNFNNINNYIVNTGNYLRLNTQDGSGRQTLSEHYILNGFTGQSWLAKDNAIENQLIHTTSQFAVTYDSFARIPFNVRRNNPNGEGILETLPTYAYTTNTDPLFGIVAVNSTGELFNTGLTSGSFVPYSGATSPVDLNNQSLSNVASITSNGSISGTMFNGSNTLMFYNDLFAFGAPAQPTFEYVRMYSTAAKVLSIKGFGNNFIANLTWSSISANRTYTFQNASGTIAFTSDITTALVPYLTSATAAATYITIASAASGYVPYTGANAPINLNTQTLSSGAHTINNANGKLTIGEAFTNGGAIWLNQASPSNTNYNLYGSSTTVEFNASSLVALSIGTTARLTVNTAQITNLVNTNIGNAVATNQRRLRVGEDTATIDIGSWVGLTSNGAIYFDATTPSGTNYTLGGSNTDTYLNAPQANGNVLMRVANTTIQNISSTAIVWTPKAATTGASTTFTFSKPNNTSQTASTAIAGWNVTANTRTWNTGNIVTQIENNWGDITYQFGGASVITTAYGNFFRAPTAGTNATITNNFAIGTTGAIQVNDGTIAGGIQLRSLTSDTSQGAIYINAATPGSTNYTLRSTGNVTALNGGTFTSMSVANVSILSLRGATSSGSNSWFIGQQVASTNLTASTEATGVLFSNVSKQFATGTFATQREFYITGMTYSAVGASTITNTYSLYVDAPVAGTNMTLTNRYAIGTNGAIIATGNITSSGTVTGASVQSLDFQSSGATMTIRTRPGNVSFIQFNSTGTTPTESWRMDTNGNLSSTNATGLANITLKASTTAYAHMNFVNGIAPTSPNNGDVWFDGTNLFMRIGGVTKTFTLV